MRKLNDTIQFPNNSVRGPSLPPPRPSNQHKATGAVAAAGGGLVASRAVKGSSTLDSLQIPAISHLEGILSYFNSSFPVASASSSPTNSSSNLLSDTFHATRTVIVELTNTTAEAITAPFHDAKGTDGDVTSLSDVRILSDYVNASQAESWCDNLQGSDFIYTPTIYSPTVRHIISIAFILVMVVTVIGNSIIIIIVITDRPLRRITSGLVVSMAVADILMALCGELQSVIMMLTEAAWVMSDTMCELFTSADLYFSLSEMLHITCLAADRYLAICYPFKYERIGRRYFFFSLLISWTLPAAFSFLPILLHWHHVGQEELYKCLRESEYHVCTLFPNRPYSTVSFLAMYVAPTALMCYCYAHIYGASKSQRKRMSSVTLGAYSDVEISEVSPLGAKTSDASFPESCRRKFSITGGFSCQGAEDTDSADFVHFTVPRRCSVVSRRQSTELDASSLQKYDLTTRRSSVDRCTSLNGCLSGAPRKVSISEEKTIFELTPFEKIEDVDEEGDNHNYELQNFKDTSDHNGDLNGCVYISSNEVSGTKEESLMEIETLGKNVNVIDVCETTICDNGKCCSDVYTLQDKGIINGKPFQKNSRERSDTELTELEPETTYTLSNELKEAPAQNKPSVLKASRRLSRIEDAATQKSFERQISFDQSDSFTHVYIEDIISNGTSSIGGRKDDLSEEPVRSYSGGILTHPPRDSITTLNGRAKVNGIGGCRGKENGLKKHKHIMFRKKRSLSGHKLGLLGEDFRAARSICIVFLCYTITWSPYWFIILVMPYAGPTNIPDPVIGVGIWLAYFGSALNPFVYYFSNTNVKKGIKRLVRKMLHKHGRHLQAFQNSFP